MISYLKTLNKEIDFYHTHATKHDGRRFNSIGVHSRLRNTRRGIKSNLRETYSDDAQPLSIISPRNTCGSATAVIPVLSHQCDCSRRSTSDLSLAPVVGQLLSDGFNHNDAKTFASAYSKALFLLPLSILIHLIVVFM